MSNRKRNIYFTLIIAVILILSPLIAKAVLIGDYPGLKKLIDMSDAIVILRIDSAATCGMSPSLYMTYDCYIYQTLKGNIPKNTRIKLQLMDTNVNFVPPYGCMSTHLMFLIKKQNADEPTEYRTLGFQGANVRLSPFGNEKTPKGSTLEEQIRNLIKDSIEYWSKEQDKERRFLEMMIGGDQNSITDINSDPNSSQNIAELRKWQEDFQGDLLGRKTGVKPWYDNLYYYSRWPKEKPVEILEERKDIPYSYETLINYVIRPGVLDKKWAKNVLRIKEWIPGYEAGMKLDAYLYRQAFEEGTLHICDTRSTTVIAFASKQDVNFTENPRKSLNTITGKLFTMSFPDDPNILWLKYDEASKMYYGATGYGSDRPAIVLPGQKFEEKPAFDFVYSIAERVMVFRFDKRYIPGSETRLKLSDKQEIFPLFGKTPDEFVAANSILEQLEKITEPNAEDIPRVLKILARSPEGPTWKMYLDNRFLYKAIGDAKIKALNILHQSIESIKNGGIREVELIKQALTAEKYFPEPNEALGNLDILKKDAVDALYRINTDDAAILHLQILMQEKSEIDSGLLGEFGKYPLFRSRFEKIYKQQKAAGLSTWKVDLYKIFIEDLKQNPIPGVTLTSEKPKNKMIIWIGICAGVLFVCGIFMRHLSKHKKS